MKLRTVTLLVLALLAAGIAGWAALGRRGEPPAWRTVEVTREDVRKAVTATGTLEAVTTVDVGTQVSGIIAEILVDFNDEVAEGQLLARIDTDLMESDIAAAQAQLAQSQASRERLDTDLERAVKLSEMGAISAAELETAQAEAKVARAQVRAAQVALSRARRNIGYATITSPIDGTVIQRSVDEGQTVNAGMSAPTLFVIAGDLARMQILASVDESDIGQIQPGQKAEFTVQSWPNRTFAGTVRQVRLQSATAESVVTYPVVIDVDNSDGALLPGMTATVEFIVAEAPGALCVSSAALRYQPDETVQVVGDRPDETQGERGKSKGGRREGAGSGVLWIAEGQAVRALPVQTGLRGAECTEISGEGVAEGLAAVVGVERTEEEAAGSSSPFQQQKPGASGGGMRRPGGGF